MLDYFSFIQQQESRTGMAMHYHVNAQLFPFFTCRKSYASGVGVLYI